MTSQQEENKSDITHILEEQASRRQWTSLCHLIDMAEARHGASIGQLSPSATFNIPAVFHACIDHAATASHLLHSGAARTATAADILQMLTDAVAAGSSQYVQHLRALPEARNITAKDVANCCYNALQQRIGVKDDGHIQLGRRDPKLVCELTKLPGAAQIPTKYMGQLLRLSVVAGGCLDVKALANLPAAVKVHGSVLGSMKFAAAAIPDVSLQRAVHEFDALWASHCV